MASITDKSGNGIQDLVLGTKLNFSQGVIQNPGDLSGNGRAGGDIPFGLSTGGAGLSIDRVQIPEGMTGVVAQLSSTLEGVLTFSRVSGIDVTVSSDGAVSFTTGLASGDTRPLVARVQNNLGDAIERLFTFIGVALPLVITGTPPSNGIAGELFSFTPSVTGGTPPYTFSLLGSPIPGLTLNTTTGELSGTLVQGTYSGRSIRVTDLLNNTADLLLPTLTVSASSTGPTWLVPPSITGETKVSADLTFDVGITDTGVFFEIEIVETDGVNTTVLLARQPVDGASTGSINPTVGWSLVLRVWATDNNGNTSYAESAPFGPMTADAPVAAFFFNNPAISLDGWVNLGVDANTVLYADPPGYGWEGTSTPSHGYTFGSKTAREFKLVSSVSEVYII